MDCWSNNSFFHTLKFLLFSALAPSSSSAHASKSNVTHAHDHHAAADRVPQGDHPRRWCRGCRRQGG